MVERVQGRCSEPGCEAGRGGACIELLALEECPHFVVGPPEPEILTTDDVIPGAEEDELIPVRGGASLSAVELDSRLRQSATQARSVALVGDPEVGKTTLISSLYDLVRAGKMALGFAGSDTLRGFEQRCHLSRTASGRKEAATQRTRLLERLSFLHLALIGVDGCRRELIIADRAGEDYEPMLQRPDEAAGLTELARFDVVAVLLDGSRLSVPSQRHTQIARARRMWLAMEQAGQLLPHRRYQLILTKIDELGDEVVASEVREIFEGLASELRSRLPSIEIECHEVAARPPMSGGIPFGLGLEALVLSWLETSAPASFASPIRHREADTAFDRMTVRFCDPERT